MKQEPKHTQEAAEKLLRELSSEDFLQMLDDASPEQLHELARVGQQARVNGLVTAPLGALVKSENHSGIVSMVKWWETRRLAYNVLVGVCGLPTLLMLAIWAHQPLVLLLSGTLCFGVAANLCYSLGMPAELLTWLMWREKSCNVGPVLFTLGTVFSTVLTLGVALIVFLSMLLAL